jgi:hypothetical protein
MKNLKTVLRSFPDTIGNAWRCIYARIYTNTRAHTESRINQ